MDEVKMSISIRDGGDSVAITRSKSEDTWIPLAELFFDALRGLGYYIGTNNDLIDAIVSVNIGGEA